MAAVAPFQAAPAHSLSASAKAEAAGLTTTSTVPSYTIPRGPVTAELNFFKPPTDGSVPFNYVEAPPAGQPPRNFDDEIQKVTINDIRGRESSFNLDHDAFAIIQNVPESAEKDFTDDASIEANYYPEVEALLLANIPNSTRIVFFDHTIRRASPDAPRKAVLKVHIDQTAASAKERVNLHLGPDAERLLQGRYRIVNVWRPLNGPVVSLPLAFASSVSVKDEHLVPIEHRYPHRTGYTASVKYQPEHEFYYLSGMRNDERLLLECFDSEGLKEGTNVKGGRVPHTAFVDPRTPDGAPGRDSIEVRTLVFGP